MMFCAFTGGGTAGHIYPGLAVVDELKALCPELSFLWIGSSQGMDKHIVEESGSVDLFKGIASGKLRRYFSFKNFIDVFKIFFGFIASFFILLKYKPLFLFSKGGFVSVPPCFAAKLLGIPVYTHECDFSPGLATKLNARFAKKIFLSYEETRTFFPKEKQNTLLVFGNPVRPIFYKTDAKFGFDFLFKENQELYETIKTKPLLLVLGGSLGARQINKLVEENLEWLCEHCIVVHQRGKNTLLTETPYKEYLPYEFIYSEMPHVLAAADIVLSRAGANSLSEALVLQKPMILIPLMGSGTRGDQVENAQNLEKNKAAQVLLAEDVHADSLKKSLLFFLDKKNRTNYAENTKKMNSIEKPAQKIAEYLAREEVKGQCSMA
ncbi:MAG: UDP-N-acetylglucosamine--N-acetylmuramyl-(pentapeptide) pyrophosphoryl-undecaprenol N-acetylglucosamine transferase [Treponema sp.]|jgi:UDP-N-acetylglucosamine--N-acetylmuramyl-(pentapeptide) pyrophosphoryl-undecaprenol N-acetylglucosamine transferase|nr:UDP-N-acetylglucosamine--N-acetylmuramyl-(pentapeptide) pyrophosphoryl-undecaprenol N-acetylglucosamine transferase [Treponema sp.]